MFHTKTASFSSKKTIVILFTLFSCAMQAEQPKAKRKNTAAEIAATIYKEVMANHRSGNQDSPTNYLLCGIDKTEKGGCAMATAIKIPSRNRGRCIICKWIQF